MSGPVLVTGGTGFLGRAIIERLLEDGERPKALARSEASAGALAELGAEPVRGNVLDPEALAAAMRGCGLVYHAAGANAFCVRDPSPMFEVNVRGSENVVRAAARADVKRVVYTSSAATLGEKKGTVGTEQSPHRGSFLSDYERSKFDAERAVLKAVVDSTLSLIDIADCTNGHLLAASKGMPGERYVLSGATLTVREGLALLSRLAGLEQPVRTLPPSLAMTLATVVEAVALVRRGSPRICRELARTITHGHAYDGSKAVRELGLSYTPIEETLRRTMEWWIDQGLVAAPATREPETSS